MTSASDLARLVAAIVVIVLVAGCSPTARVTYIPDEKAYTTESLPALLASVSVHEKIGADDVAAARQQALADLRKRGPEAAELADTLTHQFPVDVNAVPIEVRKTRYEDQEAWIVIEVWGRQGEPPSYRRLWVFSAEELELLAACSEP